MPRRLLAVAAVAGLLLAGCQPATPDRIDPGRERPTHSLVKPPPPPPPPNLSSYAEVPADDYLVADQDKQSVYFQTVDGLSCKIGWMVGCDGVLRGTPAPANEVELYVHPVVGGKAAPDGFRQTSKPAFIRPGGTPPKMLPPGHKIVYRDFQCAAQTGGITMCSSGSPPASWLVLSPKLSGIGPGSPGLPANFPDPREFVVDDHTYTVGSGARNAFPFFTVASGLTCEIRVFSGGAFGCDGPLPGAPDGENEIYVDLSARGVGMRRTDSPRFTTPTYPGTIRRLPAHYRIDYTYETHTTCMATDDGGVACYAARPDRQWGFVVSSASAWTFGG